MLEDLVEKHRVELVVAHGKPLEVASDEGVPHVRKSIRNLLGLKLNTEGRNPEVAMNSTDIAAATATAVEQSACCVGKVLA